VKKWQQEPAAAAHDGSAGEQEGAAGVRCEEDPAAARGAGWSGGCKASKDVRGINYTRGAAGEHWMHLDGNAAARVMQQADASSQCQDRGRAGHEAGGATSTSHVTLLQLCPQQSCVRGATA
jgi:hypothetical protein